MSINTHLICSLKVQCSKQFLEWVNYKQPLTDKLFQAMGNAQLELLSQQWMSTDLWSKRLLEIHDDLVFQREIIMKSHGLVYWYARSIIPQTCYDLDPCFFDRLKQESIKNLIFGECRVQRIHLINYPVDYQSTEFSWVKKYIDDLHGILWVRIAEFSFQKKESFYLVEIMLPELEELTK